MSRRFRWLALLPCAALIGAVLPHSSVLAAEERDPRGHVAWVAEVLKRMQTIKPGMTRAALLKVFTTEGGVSTRLGRTFVSRECPYFKVEVEFAAGGNINRDSQGRLTSREDPHDIIVKISRPYLAYTTVD